FAIAAAGAVALGACSDDPTGLEEHADPTGVELELNGVVIASYQAGQGWTGELEVLEGEETAHIEVTFVDEDGDPIELDDDVYLEVEIEDEAIAEFEQDTPGEFGGHLHGVAQGETDATFRLMHGAVGSGHADFETTSVHVHVEVPTT
ncbi:MAG: hypothetical protein WEA34_13455, partial [Gemmatimonadota bacterium]